MTRALVLIDVQNDYFPDGKFPLWEPEAVTARLETAIARAHALKLPVIVVKHVNENAKAPLFVEGTHGVGLHERIRAAAPDARIVIKKFADSFHATELTAVLSQLGVDEIVLSGMMTQNCVTHTALSKAAEPYRVIVLSDGCTTVSEILHHIALDALSTRVTLATIDQALSPA